MLPVRLRPAADRGVDVHRRLRRATPVRRSAGPAPYWSSWRYDAAGNRTSQVAHAAGGDTTSTYTYPAAGAARPHAAQSVQTAGPRRNAHGFLHVRRRRQHDGHARSDAHLGRRAEPGLHGSRRGSSTTPTGTGSSGAMRAAARSISRAARCGRPRTARRRPARATTCTMARRSRSATPPGCATSSATITARTRCASTPRRSPSRSAAATRSVTRAEPSPHGLGRTASSAGSRIRLASRISAPASTTRPSAASSPSTRSSTSTTRSRSTATPTRTTARCTLLRHRTALSPSAAPTANAPAAGYRTNQSPASRFNVSYNVNHRKANTWRPMVGPVQGPRPLCNGFGRCRLPWASSTGRRLQGALAPEAAAGEHTSLPRHDGVRRRRPPHAGGPRQKRPQVAPPLKPSTERTTVHRRLGPHAGGLHRRRRGIRDHRGRLQRVLHYRRHEHPKNTLGQGRRRPAEPAGAPTREGRRALGSADRGLGK